jgi:hypothetical protein
MLYLYQDKRKKLFKTRKADIMKVYVAIIDSAWCGNNTILFIHSDINAVLAKVFAFLRDCETCEGVESGEYIKTFLDNYSHDDCYYVENIISIEEYEGEFN